MARSRRFSLLSLGSAARIQLISPDMMYHGSVDERSMLRLTHGAFMASGGRASSVERACRLALTGTPGTGKTTVASLLADSGITVESVEKLAEHHNCIGEVDSSDNARPVDLEALSSLLKDEWGNSPDSITVIDGHLSHSLPVDGVILLRCAPSVLEERLKKRRYSSAKATENVEWEILGGAWNEHRGEVPWIEFDTSANSAEVIVTTLRDWMADGFKPMSPDLAIDWVAVHEG